MSKKIYEIRAMTPMGTARYEIEAASYLNAVALFHRDYPTYGVMHVRMKFEDETAQKPPLRRDLD